MRTYKSGRPSFIDRLRDDALQEFKVAEKKVGSAMHFRTVFATKLIEEMDRIEGESAKIREARRKGYMLDYERKVVVKELEKLGVTKK
jgi:hypothetical protein